MKKLLFLISINLLLFSCKKDVRYNPDKHITYQHWYKLNERSADTLFSVYIPNAFTPGNTDGINDSFYPKGNFERTVFRIYNNADQLIFETMDLNKAWDGKVSASSKLVQTGVYTYQLIVHDIYNINYEYMGNVMVF